MNTRTLVNQIDNKIVKLNKCAVFAAFTGVVCPKLNNVLTKRKWIIFDNK